MSRLAPPTRARAIYEYIKQYKREHDGNSPSIRQIMFEFEINSSSMVSYYLDELVRHELIRRPQGKGASRGIEIVGGEWVMQ